MNRTLDSSLLRTFVVAIVLVLLSAPQASAQRFEWPDNPKNLTVLPDTITGQQLGQIMRGFTRALGVRCEHCHVGEPGQSLAEFDFASDDKEAKETARVMIKMVQAINGDYLSQLAHMGGDEDHDDDHQHGDDDHEMADDHMNGDHMAAEAHHAHVQVTCITCHRGRERPEMLEDIVASTAMESGVDSAIVRYRELRDEYYGGFAFDFREGTLATAAERLSDADDTEGALKLMELELEVNGESARTLATLAQFQSMAGRNDDAKRSLERAIELAPDRMKAGLQRQLERMK
ncbi:MAG: c-type cytochrome [Rhodothermales bacterium]